MNCEILNKFPHIELLHDVGVYDDYVYDLQTEDGSFQAGNGSNVISNTDSIYTQFLISPEMKENMSDREQELMIWKYSAECSDRISDTFKNPIELELEKVMTPLYLFKKKRYMMLYKEHADDTDHIDTKGLPTVRRDNCNYVKEVLNGVIDKLLYDKDIKGAEELARTKVDDLLNDRVDLDKLTISKSLKSHYKTVNKAGHKLSKPPHAMLADRMKERDAGSAPQPGDRIPYVFIQTKKKTTLQGDKSEDPEHVKANSKKLKIDSLYYLEHQVSKPLYSMFELTVKNPQTGELFDTDTGDATLDRKNTRGAQKEIKKRIWGDLELRKKNTMNGQSMISDFFTNSQLYKTESDLLPPESSDEDELLLSDSETEPA